MDAGSVRKRDEELEKAIRRILLEVWDPIGVSDVPEAADEYDDYVGGVLRLVLQRASAEEIERHLHRIEIWRLQSLSDARAAAARELARLGAP